MSYHKGLLNATKASPYSPVNSTTKVRIHTSTKDSFKGGESPVQIREAHTHNWIGGSHNDHNRSLPQRNPQRIKLHIDEPSYQQRNPRFVAPQEIEGESQIASVEM